MPQPLDAPPTWQQGEHHKMLSSLGDIIICWCYQASSFPSDTAQGRVIVGARLLTKLTLYLFLSFLFTIHSFCFMQLFWLIKSELVMSYLFFSYYFIVQASSRAVAAPGSGATVHDVVVVRHLLINTALLLQMCEEKNSNAWLWFFRQITHASLFSCKKKKKNQKKLIASSAFFLLEQVLIDFLTIFYKFQIQFLH